MTSLEVKMTILDEKIVCRRNFSN